jgi:hypothetical protein
MLFLCANGIAIEFEIKKVVEKPINISYVFPYFYAHYSIFAESVERNGKKNLKIVCLQRF